MVAIPQITRDKLASSVVGTPGTDLSGQKAEDSMAGAANDIGQAVGQYAIQRQGEIDQAETNKLMLDNKMAAVTAMEQSKTTYADNPEKAGPAFMDQMSNILATSTQQASNPRVALMVGRGDPFFDGRMALDMQTWAVGQRAKIDQDNIINQGNQMADNMENVVNGKDPLVTNLNRFTHFADMTGNLTAGAYAAANPTAAETLKTRMLPTLATRTTYKLLQDNPAQATAFLENPGIKELFNPAPKEWDELHKTAMDRTEGMAKDAEWHSMLQPLIDSPQVINQVASGQVDYNAIAKMPPSPLRDGLLKMSMQVGSTRNEGEQAESVAKFAADAADIGAKYKSVGRGKSVSDLVNFNTELVQAHNDGLITPETFRTYMNNLALPLRDAVLKAHDPETLNKMNQGDGGPLATISNWLFPKPQPDQIVDKYVGGYNVIQNWAKSQNADDNWSYKAEAIQKYMKVSDSRGPEDRDPLGRPWTPATNARDVMGILEGRDTISTVLGPKKIAGYNNATNKPTVDWTPDELDQIKRLKALQAQGA